MKMPRITRGLFSSIAFSQHGPPRTSLRVLPSSAESKPPLPLGPDQIKISIKAVPLLADDLRVIQGRSLHESMSNKLNSTEIAGSVGVGIVSAVGSHVRHVAPNDMVLVNSAPSSRRGVWSDSIEQPAANVIKLSNFKSCVDAAYLPYFLAARGILACAPLEEGDTVVQLDDQSGISNAIKTLCKHMKYHLISLPNDGSLLTSNKSSSTPSPSSSSTMAKTVLASVTGKVQLAISHRSHHPLSLSRSLAPFGVLVCSNGLIESVAEGGSVSIPVSPLLFSGVKIKGFDYLAWVHSGMEDGEVERVSKMMQLEDVGGREGKGVVYKVSEYAAAIDRVEVGLEAVVLEL